jgi:hypothetical protein
MKKLIYFFAIATVFTLTAQGQEAPLETFVGKYSFPEGSPVPFVDVKISNGILVGESQMGIATLQRLEGDRFSIVEHNGIAEFRRNGDGKVIGIKVLVGDLVMEGNRDALWLRAVPWHPLNPMKL